MEFHGRRWISRREISQRLYVDGHSFRLAVLNQSWWRLVQGELTTWAIYYVLKLLLSVIIRFFHSPFHDPVELDKTDTFPDSTITIF